jgi:hypothetical protein
MMRSDVRIPLRTSSSGDAPKASNSTLSSNRSAICSRMRAVRLGARRGVLGRIIAQMVGRRPVWSGPG